MVYASSSMSCIDVETAKLGKTLIRTTNAIGHLTVIRKFIPDALLLHLTNDMAHPVAWREASNNNGCAITH